MKLASPGVSQAKVTPRKRSSTQDTLDTYLEAEELDERKTKIGILVFTWWVSILCIRIQKQNEKVREEIVGYRCRYC